MENIQDHFIFLPGARYFENLAHVPQHGIYNPHYHPNQPRRKVPRQRGLGQAGAAAHIAGISSKLNASADPTAATIH